MLVWWRVLHRYASTNRHETHSSLYTEQLLCAHALTQRGLCTEKLLHTDAFTHRGFHAKKLLHTEAVTHRCFTQRCFCTEQHLHTDAFIDRRFYTDAFTHRSFYTEKLLHGTAFTQRSFPLPPEKTGKQVFELGFFPFPLVSLPENECQWMLLGYPRIFVCPLDSVSTFYKWHDAHMLDPLLQTGTKRTAACTQSSFYAHMLLHREVCAQRSFYTQMRLHTEAFTQRNFYTQKRPRSALFDRTCTIAVWSPVRLFASSSWSPTFRVPLPKFLLRQRWHDKNWPVPCS